MISLDLKKSSEVRIAGDQSRYYCIKDYVLGTIQLSLEWKTFLRNQLEWSIEKNPSLHSISCCRSRIFPKITEAALQHNI